MAALWDMSRSSRSGGGGGGGGVGGVGGGGVAGAAKKKQLRLLSCVGLALGELRRSIASLVRRQLFPYNAQPLLKWLDRYAAEPLALSLLCAQQQPAQQRKQQPV